MKYYIVAVTVSLALAIQYCQAAQKPSAATALPPAPPAPGNEEQAPRRPKINWGKCPQLEPTEKDIEFKSGILQECLRQNPPPTQVTSQEQIIDHQRNVTECALKIENWFDKNGQYKFDKAEKEIRNKKLSKDMEQALLESHKQCVQVSKDRREQSKNMNIVEQVQIYQGCMDAHITQNCQIQIGV